MATEQTLSERVAELERTLADVTREREELAGWKRSAMEVLAEWDRVWEAAGKPGPLGSSKALNTQRVVTAAESRLADAERRGAREFSRRVLEAHFTDA